MQSCSTSRLQPCGACLTAREPVLLAASFTACQSCCLLLPTELKLKFGVTF